MLTYLDRVNKNRAEHPEQKTLPFENFDNVIFNSDSINPQKKKIGDSKIVRKVARSISTKMRRIRV